MFNTHKDDNVAPKRLRLLYTDCEHTESNYKFDTEYFFIRRHSNSPMCFFSQVYPMLSTISVFSAHFCTSAPDFYTRNLPIHRSKLSSSVCWLGFKWSFPEPISVNSYAKQAPLIGMKAVLKSFSLTIYMHFCSAQDNLLFRMYVN